MSAPTPGPLAARLRALDPGIGVVLCAFLASRAVLLAVGLVARGVLWPFVGHAYIWRYHPRAVWDIWAVFDAGWYLQIARDGYSAGGGAGPGSTLAFFPVYPLAVHALALLTGDAVVAGVLLSNACFLGALLLLYRWVGARADAGTAAAAVALAAFFPGSYVFSSVYSEALFLLLLLGSLTYAARGRWGMAGLLGAALSGTRLVGVAVLLPLALLWWQAHGRAGLRQGAALARLATLALVPAGLLAFMLFLGREFLDPLAFLHVQATWGRAFQNPALALLAPLRHPTLYNLFQASFGIGCFVALFPVVRRRLWPEVALALALLAVPLCSGLPYAPLASYARYCLVAWPVVMGLALVVRDRPLALGLLLGALAALDGLLMAFWATGMLFAI